MHSVLIAAWWRAVIVRAAHDVLTGRVMPAGGSAGETGEPGE